MPKRPPLTVKQIVAGAEAHQQRTGHWPHAGTGKIPDAPHETWGGVNSALRKGQRGLPGGSSLSRWLDQRCGLLLTVEKVLSWMKRHRRCTGRWPVAASGAVRDAPVRIGWLLIMLFTTEAVDCLAARPYPSCSTNIAECS
jgi:hypothetical protein